MSRPILTAHTDVTIPYDELGHIRVAAGNGRVLSVIEEGRFVPEGTEELNQGPEILRIFSNRNESG